MTKHTGEYPADWQVVAARVKAKAGNKCERCGHENTPDGAFVLTVHHLDCDKANCAEWNLAALCQRCHLHIQGVVDMAQFYMFEHSEWMRPHVEGYYAAKNKSEVTVE